MHKIYSKKKYFPRKPHYVLLAHPKLGSYLSSPLYHVSMLFMFFFLLFDCLIRVGGSGWVGWAFAHPIFLDEKDRLILFCLLALLLMQQLPTQTVGGSTDPVNDIDGEGWKRLFYDLIVDNLLYHRI